jgi:hypothetical protein
MKKKNKGASTIDRKEERLPDKRKKCTIGWDEEGGAPIWKEKRTYATIDWAHPRSSFKVTYIDNQRCHEVRQAQWRSWICASESGPSRVGSKRLSRLRRGLIDERVNNNFCPRQSSEVDTVCRGATGCRITFVIGSGFTQQLEQHPNNKIRVYQYQFWILSFNIYISISDFKRMDNELRWINKIQCYHSILRNIVYQIWHANRASQLASYINRQDRDGFSSGCLE